MKTSMDPETREWLRKVAEDTKRQLVPLPAREANRRRNRGGLTTGQGKMCSFSGNP
jgi:hypothetical protein